MESSRYVLVLHILEHLDIDIKWPMKCFNSSHGMDVAVSSVLFFVLNLLSCMAGYYHR